jgi:hypothetical protein
MEAGTSNGGSGILDRSTMASPLSPDLLMAVDPREVNSGALLSFEENRKEKANGRGKSVVKNQVRSVVSENSSVLERYSVMFCLFSLGNKLIRKPWDPVCSHQAERSWTTIWTRCRSTWNNFVRSWVYKEIHSMPLLCLGYVIHSVWISNRR